MTPLNSRSWRLPGGGPLTVVEVDNNPMPHPTDYVVRDYAGTDEQSWLRCRILAFLPTANYDDVVPTKPVVETPGFELVAVSAYDAAVGLMDVTVDDAVDTIDTLALHPDHQSRGIARTLLGHAMTRAHSQNLTALSAWTRPSTPPPRIRIQQIMIVTISRPQQQPHPNPAWAYQSPMPTSSAHPQLRRRNPVGLGAPSTSPAGALPEIDEKSVAQANARKPIRNCPHVRRR